MNIWRKLKSLIKRFMPLIVMSAIIIERRRKLVTAKQTITKKKNVNSFKGRDIVDEAKRHYHQVNAIAAEDILSPSIRWSEYLKRIRSDIETLTTINEAIHYAQNRVNFDHRDYAPNVLPFFLLYEESLKGEFPHFAHVIGEIEDSPYSDPYTIAKFRGRLVSNVLFYHLRIMLFCLTFIKEPKIVCEIGTGYGGSARLWLENSIHRPSTYVLIDFPECLFFAEVFLKANLGGYNFLYVTDHNQLDPIRVEKYSVILCPINFISALANLHMDIVINTGSMAEMTEEWIDFWMEWLNRQNCRYFYSLNYFAQPLSFMAEGANTWAPRLSPNWTVLIQSFNPAFIKQQSSRNFGEILAEKLLIQSDENKEMLSNIYKSQRGRILDGQMLLEAMDIIRINQNQEIIWDILQRCLFEMVTIPKEAQWLSNYLNNHADDSFFTHYGEELHNIIEKLNHIRFAGQENRVSD